MKYQTAPGYVVRQFMNECLLVPVEMLGGAERRMAIMNTVGQFLWEQMQQPRSVEQLTEALCAEFDVTAEVAVADIRACLATLEENHCIVRTEE